MSNIFSPNWPQQFWYGKEQINYSDDWFYCIPANTFGEGLMSLDPKKAKEGKDIVDSLALHPWFTEQLAKVAEVSIKKGYEPFNWTKNESPTRVSTFIHAGQRHLNKAKKGYNINKENALNGELICIDIHHLVYAAYNMLMAAYLIKYLPDHDDRSLKENK